MSKIDPGYEYDEHNVNFCARWCLERAGGDPLKAETILGWCIDDTGGRMHPNYCRDIAAAIWDIAS
jgi:hypothetical protein